MTNPLQSAHEALLVTFIGMGADNYQRLLRVCPDDDLRRRALKARANVRVAEITRAFNRVMLTIVEATATLFQTMQRSAAFTGLVEPDAFTPGTHVSREVCWRCDARSAVDDLGLCEPCKVSLTKEQSP